MDQSVLNSTKKILGIDPSDASFDQDVLTHINTAFSHLQQLGIGPESGVFIEDDSAEWGDLFAENTPIFSSLKTYVYLKVRSIFDPPQMQHVMTAMQAQVLELETRLSIMRENEDWFLPTPVPNVIDAGDADPDPSYLDGGGA